MVITQEEAKTAVTHGIKRLNKKWHSRKWIKKINPETLDVYSISNCILGQIYGCYGIGINRLNADYKDNDPFKWGFSVCSLDSKNNDEYAESCKVLTEEWKRQLTALAA